MSSPRINDDVEQTIFITRTNLYNSIFITRTNLYNSIFITRTNLYKSIFQPQELEANKSKYVCKVHKNNFQLTWTNRLLNKTRKIFGYKSNRKHKNKTKMSNI